MSKKNLNRAQRLTVDEIATVAAVGVARALAARQTAAVELSAEELAQVEGGIGFVNPIIYGGPFFSSALVAQPGDPGQLVNPGQLANPGLLTMGLR